MMAASNMTHHEAGNLLLKAQNRIANSLSTQMFSEHSAILESFGLDEKTMEEYSKNDITRLFYSVIAKRPYLFTNYVKWQRSMLSNRAVPEIVLEMNMEMFKKAVADELGPEARAIVMQYINEAHETVKSKLEKEVSFLKSELPYHDMASTYLDLLLQDHSDEAVSMIKKAMEDGQLKPIEAYKYIFTPVQYEVGRLWQVNDISVLQEHFCTSVTRGLMSWIRYQYDEGASKKDHTILAMGIGGELHDTGIRLVSDYFMLNGWRTYYVGGNTPMREVFKYLEEKKIDLLALSATMSPHLFMVKSTIEKTRERGHKTLIAVGGYIFNEDPNLQKVVGADIYAPGPEEALELVNQQLANRG